MLFRPLSYFFKLITKVTAFGSVLTVYRWCELCSVKWISTYDYLTVSSPELTERFKLLLLVTAGLLLLSLAVDLYYFFQTEPLTPYHRSALTALSLTLGWLVGPVTLFFRTVNQSPLNEVIFRLGHYKLIDLEVLAAKREYALAYFELAYRKHFGVTSVDQTSVELLLNQINGQLSETLLLQYDVPRLQLLLEQWALTALPAVEPTAPTSNYLVYWLALSIGLSAVTVGTAAYLFFGNRLASMDSIEFLYDLFNDYHEEVAKNFREHTSEISAHTEKLTVMSNKLDTTTDRVTKLASEQITDSRIVRNTTDSLGILKGRLDLLLARLRLTLGW